MCVYNIPLASFPDLPRFYFPFAFTIIHESRYPSLPCFYLLFALSFSLVFLFRVLLGKQTEGKMGSPGNEANILHVEVMSLFYCYCSMFSYVCM